MALPFTPRPRAPKPWNSGSLLPASRPAAAMRRAARATAGGSACAAPCRPSHGRKASRCRVRPAIVFHVADAHGADRAHAHPGEEHGADDGAVAQCHEVGALEAGQQRACLLAREGRGLPLPHDQLRSAHFACRIAIEHPVLRKPAHPVPDRSQVQLDGRLALACVAQHLQVCRDVRRRDTRERELSSCPAMHHSQKRWTARA